MTISFWQNHISYIAQDRVKEILSALSKFTDIFYFNYSVTYSNNTHFTLHTNDKFYESWFKNEFPMWECHLGSGWYLCEEIQNHEKTNFAHSLGIGNGIIHLHQLEDRTEAIVFASSPDNTKILNFYLNNLNLLTRFKKHFQEEAKDLICKANNQLINLSNKMVNDPSFNDQISKYFDENLSLQCQFESSPFSILSKRELQCFSLLIRGYSLLSISVKLNIAMPTVSNYITRIKQKLGCNKKEELDCLAQKEKVVEYFL
jgi:DNA-binding CsgD family transcriptional regulator